MRIYKHNKPRSVIVPLIFFGALGVLGIVTFIGTAIAGEVSGPPPFLFLIFTVYAVGFGWLNLGMAMEARLGEDGYVEFIGPLRRVRVAVLDLVSIVPSSSGMPVYVVRHCSGRFRVDSRLDRMHELVAELKRQNPGSELRGI